MNLFLAVLKIKFAKAQTLFKNRLSKMSKRRKKNVLMRMMDKGKKKVSDYAKKKKETSEVCLCTSRVLSLGCRQGAACCWKPGCTAALLRASAGSKPAGSTAQSVHMRTNRAPTLDRGHMVLRSGCLACLSPHKHVSVLQAA